MSRFSSRQMVDEQHAFEMVHLVLEADRQQAVELLLVGLAMLVEPAGADAVGALDLGILVGDRQAALGVGHFLVRVREDLGVDEHPRLLDPARRILGPRGSCRSMTSTRLGTPTWIAARPMPGASYIVSNMSAIERAQLVVDRLDGRGDLAQARVGDFDDAAEWPWAAI